MEDGLWMESGGGGLMCGCLIVDLCGWPGWLVKVVVCVLERNLGVNGVDLGVKSVDLGVKGVNLGESEGVLSVWPRLYNEGTL